jgi:hypothetical protein
LDEGDLDESVLAESVALADLAAKTVGSPAGDSDFPFAGSPVGVCGGCQPSGACTTTMLEHRGQLSDWPINSALGTFSFARQLGH